LIEHQALDESAPALGVDLVEKERADLVRLMGRDLERHVVLCTSSASAGTAACQRRVYSATPEVRQQLLGSFALVEVEAERFGIVLAQPW
jgi:hypothetical protein